MACLGTILSPFHNHKANNLHYHEVLTLMKAKRCANKVHPFQSIAQRAPETLFGYLIN